MERLTSFVPIVHIATAVLLIIELGLVSYLVSVVAPYTPSRISFMLFNVIWSILVLAYLALCPLYFSDFYIPLAVLGLEVVTMIFWFAGSIALAAAITPYCHGNSFCGSANAAAAFGFFIWAAFAFLAFIDARAALQNRRRPTANASAEGTAKPYVAA